MKKIDIIIITTIYFLLINLNNKNLLQQILEQFINNLVHKEHRIMEGNFMHFKDKAIDLDDSMKLKIF